MERRVDAMSGVGEFECPPRNPVKPCDGGALPCPELPNARVPAGLEGTGAVLGADLTGAAARGGAGGGRTGSDGAAYDAFCAAGWRAGIGAGGSGIPATGIAAESDGAGGVPMLPLRGRA